MASGFDKFINSLLQERTATPLYTTFGISWFLWNWKVVYFSLFVSEQYVPDGMTKLAYVVHMSNWTMGFWLPLFSTALFIFVLPHLANYTYETSLKRRRERINKKAEIIDKDRLMTREESVQVRTEANDRIDKIEKENERIRREHNLVDKELEHNRNEQTNKAAESLKFRILSATYGSGHSSTAAAADVKSTLNSMIVNETSLSLEVNSDSLKVPDPAPGYWKLLLIAYTHNGIVRTIRAIEGDHVTFSANALNITATIQDGIRTVQINKALKDAQLPVMDY